MIDNMGLDIVGLNDAVKYLLGQVQDLTKRINALETVIADALPNFNNSTISEYINLKRCQDLEYYQKELFKNPYLLCTPDTNTIISSPYQSVNITLGFGSLLVYSQLQLKKPVLTY